MEKSESLSSPHRLTGAESFFSVSARRRSHRKFSQRALSLELVKKLMSVTFKPVRTFEDPRYGKLLFTPVASGGALHGNRPLLLSRNISGLKQGLFSYDSETGQFDLIAGMGALKMATLFADLQSAAFPPWEDCQAPAAAILFTPYPSRNLQKYGEILGSELLWMDLGALFQHLSLTACALGIGGVPLAKSLKEIPHVEQTVGAFVFGSPL